MKINREFLETEQKRLQGLRENFIAQANACGGALECIASQLLHLDKPEPIENPKRENKP